jgi:hypothetical protein
MEECGCAPTPTPHPPAFLQVYVEEFEQDFLNDTENFYSKEAFDCLSKSTCPEYLVKVRRPMASPHPSHPLRRTA